MDRAVAALIMSDKTHAWSTERPNEVVVYRAERNSTCRAFCHTDACFLLHYEKLHRHDEDYPYLAVPRISDLDWIHPPSFLGTLTILETRIQLLSSNTGAARDASTKSNYLVSNFVPIEMEVRFAPDVRIVAHGELYVDHAHFRSLSKKRRAIDSHVNWLTVEVSRMAA